MRRRTRPGVPRARAAGEGSAAAGATAGCDQARASAPPAGTGKPRRTTRGSTRWSPNPGGRLRLAVRAWRRAATAKSGGPGGGSSRRLNRCGGNAVSRQRHFDADPPAVPGRGERHRPRRWAEAVNDMFVTGVVLGAIRLPPAEGVRSAGDAECQLRREYLRTTRARLRQQRSFALPTRVQVPRWAHDGGGAVQRHPRAHGRSAPRGDGWPGSEGHVAGWLTCLPTSMVTGVACTRRPHGMDFATSNIRGRRLCRRMYRAPGRTVVHGRLGPVAGTAFNLTARVLRRKPRHRRATPTRRPSAIPANCSGALESGFEEPWPPPHRPSRWTRRSSAPMSSGLGEPQPKSPRQRSGPQRDGSEDRCGQWHRTTTPREQKRKRAKKSLVSPWWRM